jgi:predicted heme/steroid binding protein
MERSVTRAELSRQTGERGTRCFVAFAGIVYDVTDCPKWRTGMHEQLHFAGQDLTDELPEAPHASEVFGRPCVQRVGRLAD